MSFSILVNCPKCKFASGDDWQQCRGSCPMPESPYFNQVECEKYFNTPPGLLGRGALAREVVIDYTNWKGNRRTRRIAPIKIHWNATKEHPQPQYLLEALDLEEDSQPIKFFAMEGIHSWKTS